MNIYRLDQDLKDSALDSFIDFGIDQIARKKTWCGMSLNGFREWLEFRLNVKTPEIDSAEFKELIERYIASNKSTVVKEFEADCNQQFENDLITQFEQIQLSNY